MRFVVSALLALSVLHIPGSQGSNPVSYNPKEVEQKAIGCKGSYDKTENLPDAQIYYVDFNPEGSETLIMLHGWPTIWHTWKYQIEEFKDNYRVIALNLRGFGASTLPGGPPPRVTWADHVSDVVCVLNHAGVASAICVGNDWGTQLCYESARMRPDIFKGVVGITIPYLPSAGGHSPTAHLIGTLPKLAYQLFLGGDNAHAAAELDADPRRTLRATLRSVVSPPPDAFLRDTESFLSGWKDIAEIPPIPFLTSEEEDYWVEQFSIQGFGPTLSFYIEENRRRSREFDRDQGNFTIPQPVLSILPTNDPVSDWVYTAQFLQSANYLPNLTQKALFGAHWVHLERPAVVNNLIHEWLDLNFLPEVVQRERQLGHSVDEL